jgi:hypothetical protein
MLHLNFPFCADNVYQPSKCEHIIEELRQCCIKNNADSVVCTGIDVSRPYEHSTVDYVSHSYVLQLTFVFLTFMNYKLISYLFFH